MPAFPPTILQTAALKSTIDHFRPQGAAPIEVMLHIRLAEAEVEPPLVCGSDGTRT